MPKVLHVSANTYPSLNQEHSTKKIWIELAKGFEEYHIMGRAEDNRFHTEQEGNIYLHRIPKLCGTKTFLFTSFFMIYYIKRYKIDRILCQCAILGGLAAVLYSKKAKIPVMVEIHGTIYFEFLRGHRLYDKAAKKILYFVYKNATVVRALNSLMKQQLINLGVQANIVIIENRVNFNTFSIKKNDFHLHNPIRIVSVGGFNWEKGYLETIKMIKELQNEYPVELCLIGGGQLKKDYLKEIDGGPGFKLYDNLPQEQFVNILVDSDIYIQPSLSEGVPRATLEAMACQLPIVSSDAGFITGSIIPNQDALIFRAGHFEELKARLIELINNPILREKLAVQAADDAHKKFEWDRQFEIYRAELLKM